MHAHTHSIIASGIYSTREPATTHTSSHVKLQTSNGRRGQMSQREYVTEKMHQRTQLSVHVNTTPYCRNLTDSAGANSCEALDKISTISLQVNIFSVRGARQMPELPNDSTANRFPDLRRPRKI